MIAQAHVESLKSSTDIVAVAQSFGLELKQKGKDHFAKCPFHEDQDASLSISRDKGVYHCFGCGAKGNAIQLVQQVKGISFPEAFEHLAGRDLGLASYTKPIPNQPVQTTIVNGERQQLLSDVWTTFCRCYSERPDGRQYLEEQRGLRRVEVEVGFCPPDFGSKLDKATCDKLKSMGVLNDHGRPHFADCVVFALVDANKRVQGFYGRKIKGQGSHYYLPGRREGLFFRQSKDAEAVVVTESVIDGLTVMEHYGHDVLALHGVNGFTAQHMEHLSQYRRVYLLLDGDSTGLEASHRLAQRLTGKKTHVIELPGDEDPNSFLKEGNDNHKTWLASQLNTLEPKQKKMTIHEEKGALVIRGGVAHYTVQGLTAHSMDRLKVAVRVTLEHNQDNASAFFMDTPDLYSRRARSSFIDGICEEFGVAEEDVQSDVKSLVTLLEAERLKMLETPEIQVPEMSEEERAAALCVLRSPTLITDILRDLDVLMVGEENAKLVGYLGSISRLLDKPLGVLVVSRSGAGKTTLQETVCDLVPLESLQQFTRITGQSLFYGDVNSLKHKVLAIEEEGGMEGAIYAIRTLQSSQKLVLATTRSDPKTGRFRQESYTVEGPVFIMISTTNPDALGGETRNRFVVLTIDESEEQTNNILRNAMLSHTLEGRMNAARKRNIVKRHHHMQRMLKPIEVVNPYAQQLDYSIDRLQMRREQGKYATLIDCVALLHQHQRAVKTYEVDGEVHPYIEVTVEDIALANKLAQTFFPNSTDELAPHTRRLGVEISRLVESKQGEASFTRKELRDFCGWSDWQIREALRQLEELEYIVRVSGRNGALITYEMIVDARDEGNRNPLFLTDPKELRRCMDG